MKKRITSFFLLLVVVFGLIGCSEEDTVTNSNVTEESTEVDGEILVYAPTEEYIISCLEGTPNITEIKAATKDNDPNDGLSKDNSYYSAVYFSVDLIDQKEVSGDDLIDKGTTAGGCIEAFRDVEDALERNEYLSKFDNKILLNSGYHEVVGTLVVRTSKNLTEEQNNDLVFNIMYMLMGGESEYAIPIVDGVIIETPMVYENDEMLEYFDEETLKKISGISNIGELNLSTTYFDEECSSVPKAVLFFTMDAVKEETDNINEYMNMVNKGGCIEIYDNINDVNSRHGYLLGYFMFGLTGGEHNYINNYVIMTSSELSSSEQEKLASELTEILSKVEVKGEVGIKEVEVEQKKQIKIGTSHDDFVGVRYDDIIEILEGEGFTKIVEDPKVIEFDLDKESICTEITVAGNNDFSAFDKFNEDDEIVITYYTGALAGAPDNWFNLLEKHYTDVQKQFKDAGFTNITCVGHEIDYDESKVFEGSVVNIAIGPTGSICTFEKGEEWYTNVEIRIDYRVKPVVEYKPVVEPEPAPTPAVTPEPTIQPEPKTENNNSSSSSGPSVTVPDHEESGANLVWVPTQGGKKYHSKSGCSNMENPMHVTVETAIANGYTPCKRCY